MDAPATVLLDLPGIQALATNALMACGARDEAASAVAQAVAAAERDGIASHGLAYIPTYCEHLQCGKVNRAAVVRVDVQGAVVRVDADAGFAHPAIRAGFVSLILLARQFGVAVAAVRNSYNCGVLGYHTAELAGAGLVGIGFTNAPASIAPWGGHKAILGTNPISLAAPDGRGGTTLIIDQSASVVSKSEVLKRAREGRALPEGWVLDETGAPTTDPARGLRGTMTPSGGVKGVSAALLVEVMAACLTGATLGLDASAFSGREGGPPRTGQFFIAIDPSATSGGSFATRLAALAKAFSAIDGARLPGARRAGNRAAAERDGVRVARATLERIAAVSGIHSEAITGATP